MSTLSHGSPAGKLLLLLPLLLFLLLMAKPPVSPPGDEPPTTSSSAPTPPPPPDWRWGGERKYGRCPGTAIQHIICRHGSSSKYNDASKFSTNDPIEIRRLVDTALRKGKFSRTENGWKVVYDFGHKIGKTVRGEAAKKIEIFLSEMRDILTAYPIK